MSICPHLHWIEFVETDSTKSKHAGWFLIGKLRLHPGSPYSCLGVPSETRCTGGLILCFRVRISWLWVIFKVKRKRRTEIPHGFYWLIIMYLKSSISEVMSSKTCILKILGFVIVYNKGFQAVCKIKTSFIKT